MGHHLLKIQDRVRAVQDLDLALVRSVLLRGADALDLPEVKREIESWTWVGPGVWVNMDPNVLTKYPRLFDAAAEFVQGFGEEIPVSFLSTIRTSPGAHFNVPQKTKAVIDELTELKQFIYGDA